jgi:hypothetical protein
MSEVENYTNPLSGSEVIADVLSQIKKRLISDCNLRMSDGYSGGYSGHVTIKLKCHAVRTVEVNMEVPITAELKGSAVDSFPSEQVQEVEVDEEIKIPLEPNLKEVRERTKENNVEATEEAEPTGEADTSTRGRRKYARKALAGVGAVGE